MLFQDAQLLSPEFAKAKHDSSVEDSLADGGIETRIIYEFKCPIGDFEAYKLLRKEAGRDILRRIYRS